MSRHPVCVSHAASRGCSLGGTVYTPSLAQGMRLKSPPNLLQREQTPVLHTLGQCDAIQLVINKSEFSKAQTTCFQNNPSGEHFYFHIALCLGFFWCWVFLLWFSRSSYNLYHLLSKSQCRQY